MTSYKLDFDLGSWGPTLTGKRCILYPDRYPTGPPSDELQGLLFLEIGNMKVFPVESRSGFQYCNPVPVLLVFGRFLASIKSILEKKPVVLGFDEWSAYEGSFAPALEVIPAHGDRVLLSLRLSFSGDYSAQDVAIPTDAYVRETVNSLNHFFNELVDINPRITESPWIGASYEELLGIQQICVHHKIPVDIPLVDLIDPRILVQNCKNYLRYYRYGLKTLIRAVTHHEHAPFYRKLSPAVYRRYFDWIISYLHQNGISRPDLELELRRIDIDFQGFKKDFQDDYHDHYAGRFAYLVMFNYCYESENIHEYPCISHELIQNRTEIETLYSEVSGDPEVERIMTKVRFWDDRIKEKIPECIQKKRYHPADIWYAPKEYWWLHLKEVYGPG